MRIRKIWTGTVAAVAVVAVTSWASLATAALPDDVAAALKPENTLAQKTAAIQAAAIANAGNQANFTQLVQLVAAGVSQQEAAAFAGALGAACGASGDNAATTAVVVNGMVGQHPEAGGAIVGQVIAAGCSAEVAANTLQQALLTAAGQLLSLTRVIPPSNPGPGVNLNQEAFVKSLNTTRLGNRSPGLQPFVEGAVSPTKVKDQIPEQPPVYVPPVDEQ